MPVRVVTRVRAVRIVDVHDLEVARSRTMMIWQAELYKFRRYRVSFSFLRRVVVYEAVNHKVRKLL